MAGHRTRGRLIALYAAAAGVALVESLVAGAVLTFGSPHAADAPAIVVLGAGGATLVAAMVVISAGSGAPQRATAGLAVIAAAQLAVAAVLGSSIATHVADWRPFGVDGGWVAFSGVRIAICATVALGAAALLDGRRSRRAALAVTGTAVAAGTAVAFGGLAVAVTGAGCDGFRFDRERWAAAENAGQLEGVGDRERISAALVACGTLEGRTRHEVRAMLGPRDRWASRRSAGDSWSIGWVNDGGLGLGDGDQLVVRYGADGRVTSARELYD